MDERDEAAVVLNYGGPVRVPDGMNDAASSGALPDFPEPIRPRVVPGAGIAAGQPATAGQPAHDPAGELTDTEKQILDIEQHPWRTLGAKELFISTELGITSTRYYQVLNGLIDRPEALKYAPVLVKQLRDRRSLRAARRNPRTPDADRTRRTL